MERINLFKNIAPEFPPDLLADLLHCFSTNLHSIWSSNLRLITVKEIPTGSDKTTLQSTIILPGL